MAVAKHLALLDQGAEAWNRWREEFPKLRPGLTGAKLVGREFGKMDLKKVNLSGADLSGSDFTGSDLGWADLSGADLRWADLSGARLIFADLTGADLRDARGLNRRQVGEAITDKATRLPGDLDRPAKAQRS